MTRTAMDQGIRTFFLIWAGQFVSQIGTGLGSFALGVWLYQTTDSTTQFAMMAFTAAMTALLLSPIAGVVVDRYDRRRVMLAADSGAALMTLTMAYLLFTEQLQPWHVYPIVFVMVGFQVFQGPAFTASVSTLVPRKELGRASGLAQIAGSVSGIVAPVLAGFLVLVIGYHGVILLDFGTFVIAAFILLLVRIPRPERSGEDETESASLLRQAMFGWTYIRKRSGLLGLLVLFAVTNCIMGFVQILFVPLVLGFSSTAGLGTVESAAATGALLGSIALAVWGGPKLRVWGIFAALLLQGCVLFLGGVEPSVTLVAFAGFLLMFASPIINGLSQAIWQSKVAHDVQGRVFAMRRVISRAAAPVAYLAAGPLADKVFKPLLTLDGPLAETFVGRVIGVGPSRGVGLMFVVLGVFVILVTVGFFLNPGLRNLETWLPDARRPDEPVEDAPDRDAETGPRQA